MTTSVKRHRQDFMVDGIVVSDETDEHIKGFFGKWRDLSNFGKGKVTMDGRTFYTSEAAYMAQKTFDPEEKDALATIREGKDAKKYGQTVKLRPDWDDVRVEAMERVLLAKFLQNPELAELLLSTGNKYLEETNWWNDTFWGVCGGVGENHLGQCLMRVRHQLRSITL